jgi:hypothetical protein
MTTIKRAMRLAEHPNLGFVFIRLLRFFCVRRGIVEVEAARLQVVFVLLPEGFEMSFVSQGNTLGTVGYY